MLSKLEEQIPACWYHALETRGMLPTIQAICQEVANRRARETVYPNDEDLFRALRETPLEKVRVIIIGQDPYINADQATGLAFSVPKGTTPPPSLRNIFIELQNEFGGQRRNNGELSDWSAQGVLLLNAVLSVAAGKSFSHHHLGWQTITRTIVEIALNYSSPKVLMLWGQRAKELVNGVAIHNHLVLTSAHPVAMTKKNPFLGCGHFLIANQWLEKASYAPIRWV